MRGSSDLTRIIAIPHQVAARLSDCSVLSAVLYARHSSTR
jgi:hypothetical protein